MHVARYPRVHGCMSTCMWPCIHRHMAMYPQAHGHESTSEFGYALWATEQNLAQHCRSLRRILLSALGHSAESGSAPWATAQNFVKRYGP
jgi:hypothetical protein